MTPPRLLTSILLIAFFVVGVGYIYFQSADFIQGPVVVIDSPQNGASVAHPLVTIEGHVKHIARFTLNGLQIFADSNGHFEEQLLLAPGYTIMSIEGHDRFNRNTESTLELVYNAKEKN